MLIYLCILCCYMDFDNNPFSNNILIMENGNEVLQMIVGGLALFGVFVIYVFCRAMNVGSSERKAMRTSKKSCHGTKAKRD